MKIFRNPLSLLTSGVLLLLLSACRDVSNNPIYQRPAWLEGKLYTQLKAEKELSTFAELIKPTEWADILDRSGFYTIFAPTNEAFQKFFDENPEYNSIADFDSLTRDNIIRYHIIEDGWSKSQLRSLNEAGFIQPNDKQFREPRASKRQTLYRDQIKTVYVVPDLYQETIVRSKLPGTSERKVIPDTKKYVPIFFKEYLDIYDYTGEDYTFFFNRDFNQAEIYYANAQIIGDEIFAENGFIYSIDQVVLPLPNLEQALLKDYNGRSYSDFLDMLYKYPYFWYNESETKAQAGYAEGKQVDDLFDIYYPPFSIDIDEEQTGQVSGARNTTLIEHPTLVAPTNDAFQKFINNTLTGGNHYRRFEDVPDDIIRLVANSYMSRRITYEKEFKEGFVTGQNDSLILDINDVVDRQYCSNGVFIGVDEPFIPRALTAVSAPIYLRPDFSVFRRALRQSGLISELKRNDKTFTLFALDNNTLLEDSSLIIEEVYVGGTLSERLIGFNRGSVPIERFVWNGRTIATQLMNQICEGTIEGIAQKEYLRTLSGVYITFNNVTQSVQGTAPSVFGYNGDSAIVVIPTLLDEPTDNGTAFQVNGWNAFGSTPLLSTRVRAIGRSADQLENYFMILCRLAGMADDSGFNPNIISPNDYYTVFVPGDQVLRDYETQKNIKLDKLTPAELRQFLGYYFIKGYLIFTDGKKPSRKYETLRVDETSSPVFKVYSKLDLDIDYDRITALDKNGIVIFNITSNSGNANIMAYAKIVDPTLPDAVTVFTSAIVHQINTVLVYE